MEKENQVLSDIETLLDRMGDEYAKKKKAEIEKWGDIELRLSKIKEYAIEQSKAALMRNENKECLYKAIELVVNVTVGGRTNGVLGVEEAVVNYSEQPDAIEIAKDVMWAVADGIEKEVLVGEASEKYWALQPTGHEAMALYFYIKGAVMIQKGEMSTDKKEALKALLPIELYQEFEKDIKR